MRYFFYAVWLEALEVCNVEIDVDCFFMSGFCLHLSSPEISSTPSDAELLRRHLEELCVVWGGSVVCSLGWVSYREEEGLSIFYWNWNCSFPHWKQRALKV